MIRHIIVLAAGVCTLAACAATETHELPIRYPQFGVEPLEAVLAWRVDRSGELIVRVASSGCTNKDSFQVDVTGSAAATWEFNVALTRRYADTCRAFLPQGIALIWTRDELGIPGSANITVLNEIDNGRPPIPGRVIRGYTDRRVSP